MKARTTLTKSLHTVSAVTRVALYRADRAGTVNAMPAEQAVALALDMLGHDAAAYGADDETLARCIAAVAAELAKRRPMGPVSRPLNDWDDSDARRMSVGGGA